MLGKDELLAAVWPSVVVGEDSLAQCVHELRTALGADGAAIVRTVPRRGYRFDAAVSAWPGPGAAGDPDAAGPAALSAPAPASTPGLAPAAGHAKQWRTPALAGVVVAAVVAIGALAFAFDRWRAPPPAAAPPLSLVLLPLQVDDAAATPAWFADALTADLTAELGRLPSAFVISRDTAAAWRDKAADPREVARVLSVRHVVRGSVRRQGDLVQLAVSLVDGDSGSQAWAGRFEFERARLGAGLDDVVQQVARSLNVELLRAGAPRASLSPGRARADDIAMQGFSAYMRGGYSRESLLAAIALFDQAVAQDPDSVLGWSGVGIMNGLGARLRLLPDRAHAVARVSEAAARLQTLDAEHLYTLTVKAFEANLRGDAAAALLINRRAVERFPNHAPSHSAVALELINTGRFGECAAPLHRALQLSPRDPLVGAWHGMLGICHYMGGDMVLAETHSRTALQLSPNLPMSAAVLAGALQVQGRSEAAREVLSAFARRRPDVRLATIAAMLASRQPDYLAARERLLAQLRELGMP